VAAAAGISAAAVTGAVNSRAASPGCEIVRATRAALLVRPGPLGMATAGESESVASYMFRLAKENGFPRISSMLHELSVRGFMLSTADRGTAARRTVSLLEQLTLHPQGALQAMTLCQGIADMTGNMDDDGRPWILNAHRVPTRSTAALHAVCPSCLADDPEPYWRQHWRLATSTVCVRHRRRLIEACPVCGILLGLTQERLAALTDCVGCGASLAAAPREGATARRPAWMAISPAQHSARSFPVPLAYSAQWWSGLRVLLYGLCSAKVSGLVLRTSLASQHKLTLRRCQALGRRDLCLYPLDLRHDLLALLAYLVGDWPRGFVGLMQRAGVTAGRFSTAELPRPFWLDEVLSGYLDASKYSPSAEEVKSAVETLARHEGRTPSKIQLKLALGVTEAGAIDDALPMPPRRLSHTELFGVMAQLERVVKDAPAGRDEQASWTRDACAIGLAAWLGVSFRKVVGTSLHQGRELEAELRRQALRAGELQPMVRLLHGWLTDYLANVRPRFAQHGHPGGALLLGRYGKPYGGFGLAARFANLLREQELTCWPRGARLLVGAPLRNSLRLRFQPAGNWQSDSRGQTAEMNSYRADSQHFDSNAKH